MNRNREIVFYGPFGNLKNSVGGGESGNKKTILILRNAGYKVHILKKPYLLPYPVIRNIFGPIQFFFKIFFFLIKSVGKFSKANIFHLSAFYCNLIFFEFLFIRLAKFLKYSTIYEIRAGGMISAFNERSHLYRKLFFSTLKHSDLILCQGKEYCDFLANSFQLNSIFYPNFIEDKYVNGPLQFADRLSTDIMRIIYFGRLTESKNINLIIEVMQILANTGQRFHLDIIGKGESKYINNLIKIVEAYHLTQKLTFHGQVSLDGISSILPSQHFFIFPTNEAREGHSNSLTEAMSFGVVPIASDVGFNNTIINNPDLIISDFEPAKYVDKMVDIFNNRMLWKRYSIEMHSRISDNFTEKLVSSVLITAYDGLAKL